jgi:hypothetical protein
MTTPPFGLKPAAASTSIDFDAVYGKLVAPAIRRQTQADPC